jgi:hypothetical protein
VLIGAGAVAVLVVAGARTLGAVTVAVDGIVAVAVGVVVAVGVITWLATVANSVGEGEGLAFGDGSGVF